MRVIFLTGLLLGIGTGLPAWAEQAAPGTSDWEVVSETEPATKEPAKPKQPVGLGVLLSTKPDQRGVVKMVVKGSPADKVGIEPGVRILAVNGQSVAAKTSAEIVRLMHGEAGGKVKLKISFPELDKVTEYNVERVELSEPIVWISSDPSVGDGKVYHRDLAKPDERIRENTTNAIIDRLRK